MPTLDSVLEHLDRIEIVIPPTGDRRDLFAQVAALYDNRKVELTEEGHIIVLPPVGLEGGYLSGEVICQLAVWAKADKTDKAFDSSAGFYITPQQNRSPDAAWVRNSRTLEIPKKDRQAFAPFCPDFAIEVRSPSNSMPELRAKCRMYIQCGALEAWLIHPAQKLVEVYLPDGIVREYQNVEEVPATASELQSFVLDLTPIWVGL